jgi:D-lactate dehydrogenase (cytochrome)
VSAARPPRDIAAAIAELATLLGDRLSTSAAVRAHHARDISYLPVHPADAVAQAAAVEEVQAIVAICARHCTPIVPYGAGTSLEGQIAALEGGVCLDLSAMNRILAIRPEDRLARVEAGVTRLALNQALRDTGFFFSVDPGADATIGGMAATRASGTTAVRYGTMRDNVLALKVVLPDGSLISTATDAPKSSTGYDLTRLFVGSAGTLGVIVEATVKLHPVSEAISAAVCAFATLAGAVEAGMAIIQSGLPIARLELLDEMSIRAANLHSQLGRPETPTLFLEFHGSPGSVSEQAELAQSIAHEQGGRDFEWSLRPEERERLWKARHMQAFATRLLRPGIAALITDVCVPLSLLAENVLAARADMDASFVPAKMTGHIGDGNFHVSYLVMPDAPDEIAEAKRLADRLVDRALSAGGTASGEHGVGFAKTKYMRREHGGALDLMAALKAAIDPLGVMNPGKIFDGS